MVDARQSAVRCLWPVGGRGCRGRLLRERKRDGKHRRKDFLGNECMGQTDLRQTRLRNPWGQLNIAWLGRMEGQTGLLRGVLMVVGDACQTIKLRARLHFRRGGQRMNVPATLDWLAQMSMNEGHQPKQQHQHGKPGCAQGGEGGGHGRVAEICNKYNQINKAQWSRGILASAPRDAAGRVRSLCISRMPA